MHLTQDQIREDREARDDMNRLVAAIEKAEGMNDGDLELQKGHHAIADLITTIEGDTLARLAFDRLVANAKRRRMARKAVSDQRMRELEDRLEKRA